MRVIPVIDVMGGRVVRAVGGRRSEYQPIQSRLTDSTDALTVARTLLDVTGAEELYVADLDAIRGNDVVSPAVADLLPKVTCTTWVDLGLRRNADMDLVPSELRHVRPVVAFETAWERSVLYDFDADATALSIDLSGGVLLGNWRKWTLEHSRDVVGLAAVAAECGVGTVIVLDLAAVGTGEGPATLDHVRAIRAAFPKLTILTGGGVRGWDDVRRLEDAGADGVLVASALHDGTLTFPRPAL